MCSQGDVLCDRRHFKRAHPPPRHWVEQVYFPVERFSLATILVGYCPARPDQEEPSIGSECPGAECPFGLCQPPDVLSGGELPYVCDSVRAIRERQAVAASLVQNRWATR